MTTKLFGFFGIALALLFTVTTAAAPFVVESVWVVENNDWLVDVSFTQGLNLKFPDDIPADSRWAGATVTDGNTIGTIIELPMPKDGMPKGFSEAMFRIRLKMNSIIAAAFPNGFRMVQIDPFLYLISPELPDSNIARYVPWADNYWTDLENFGTKAHFGFRQYYPERTLLPTLPPEQEDESDFIKKVRKRSARNYKDGQYIGTTDSSFAGVHVIDDKNFKFVAVHQYVEGTPMPDDTEPPPFLFGGFVNSEAPLGFARQTSRETFEEEFYSIQVGTTVIPPEERQGDELYSTHLSMAFASGPKTEDDDYQMYDDNVVVCYPKQSDDRAEEDDVLSNAELDKLNGEWAHFVLSFCSNTRRSLLSLDWQRPIDLAVLYEEDILFLACASPNTKTHFDLDSVMPLVQGFMDHGHQIRPLDNPVAPFEIETQRLPGTVAGLSGYRVKASIEEGVWLDLIYVQEAGIVYAAGSLLEDDSDDAMEKQHDDMRLRLAPKIEASRKGIADKVKPPITVLHYSCDDTWFRMDYETTEHNTCFTIFASTESIWKTLVDNMPAELKLMLPFFQK